MAFDTWVDQTDHKDPPNHNIILGFNEDPSVDGTLVFLDYSASLGCSGMWEECQNSPVEVAPLPGYIMQRIDTQELEEAVAAVENVPIETIQSIIQRIRPSLLDPDEGKQIIECLIYRQSQLRGTLTTHLEGGTV